VVEPVFEEYFCPPCGCGNDDKVYDRPGSCSLCAMQLVLKGSAAAQSVTQEPSTNRKRAAILILICTSRCGITALIPRRRRLVRTDRLVYALSANTRAGRVRGRPPPRRRMRIPAITLSNPFMSCRWPAVRARLTGRQRRSAAR